MLITHEKKMGSLNTSSNTCTSKYLRHVEQAPQSRIKTQGFSYILHPLHLLLHLAYYVLLVSF